jgi:hypothetical protein
MTETAIKAEGMLQAAALKTVTDAANALSMNIHSAFTEAFGYEPDTVDTEKMIVVADKLQFDVQADAAEPVAVFFYKGVEFSSRDGAQVNLRKLGQVLAYGPKVAVDSKPKAKG